MNGGGGDNQQPTGPRGGGMMKLNLGGASNGMTQNSRAVNQNVNMMMMQAKKWVSECTNIGFTMFNYLA